MLDSLVRVSRRVLKVPKAVASPTGNGGAGPRTSSTKRPAKRPATATRSVNPSEASLSTSQDALNAAQYRVNENQYRRAVGPGEHRRSAALTRESCAAGYRPGRWPTPNGSRRPTRGEVHAGDAGHGAATACRERVRSIASRTQADLSLTMNLPDRSFGFLRFTPERFHVLLNSLFKVLFNFPSRYLFAIGLVVVFSLRWSLPPA